MDNQSKPWCEFWETVQNGLRKLSIQVVNHRYYCSYLSLEETNTGGKVKGLVVEEERAGVVSLALSGEKDAIGVLSTLEDYYELEDRIVNPGR